MTYDEVLRKMDLEIKRITEEIERPMDQSTAEYNRKKLEEDWQKVCDDFKEVLGC